MTDTPPEPPDVGPEGPVEDDDDTDVEGNSDGDETLVSKGDPPSTANA